MQRSHSFLKREFNLLKRELIWPIVVFAALFHVEFDAVVKKNQIKAHYKVIFRSDAQHGANLSETALDNSIFNIFWRNSLNEGAFILFLDQLLLLC